MQNEGYTLKEIKDNIVPRLNNLGMNAVEIEVSAHNGTATVSIVFNVKDSDLPAELIPYAYQGDLDRMIYRGNTDKKTYSGANFELALQEYATNKMHNDPEYIQLEKTLSIINTMETLKEFDTKHREIWNRICSSPEIILWERELEEYE